MVHFASRGGDKRVLGYIVNAQRPVTRNEIKKALGAFISADGVNISLSSLLHKQMISETNYKFKPTELGIEKYKEISTRGTANDLPILQ
jgi:hypothetical protein